MDFSELSYASPGDPRLKRWAIRAIEAMCGRKRLLTLYRIWREDIVGRSDRVMGDLLSLIDVRLDVSAGQWPPRGLPDQPLVMIANHPFGIGDGIAILALAEQLGRPFRVLINKELLKVPEIRPYSLSIDFAETKEAMANNLAVRREALALLKSGVTIVVFPAGGVATARAPFGRASELPWKTFTARLIREAEAAVLPIHFEGQNSWLFHLASQVSLTLRLSLLVREFKRLVGSVMRVRIGEVISYETLAAIGDRKHLMAYLYQCVLDLGRGPSPSVPTSA